MVVVLCALHAVFPPFSTTHHSPPPPSSLPSPPIIPFPTHHTPPPPLHPSHTPPSTIHHPLPPPITPSSTITHPSTHHPPPLIQADTRKRQQLESRIRQLELEKQMSELTKQQIEEEHRLLAADKGRLEAFLVQKEQEMNRMHVTLEVS